MYYGSFFGLAYFIQLSVFKVRPCCVAYVRTSFHLWLNSIPLYVSITLCLSLHLSMDTYFPFLAIVNEYGFFFFLITISSICFRMRYRIMISLVPFSISYLYDFFFPLTVAQVKYKADLKKLHKPVTDMKESLIMNHVLNTSHLASSVSSIVCSKNSLLHPFTAKFLL